MDIRARGFGANAVRNFHYSKQFRRRKRDTQLPTIVEVPEEIIHQAVSYVPCIVIRENPKNLTGIRKSSSNTINCNCPTFSLQLQDFL